MIEQTNVARAATRVFGDVLKRHRALGDVFMNAGIERRRFGRPLQWYLETQDWTARTEAYLDEAAKLFQCVARDALGRAGLEAQQVDVVVTVSSTGIATPTLDARVGPALGLRPNTVRVPIFGLGCAGGVSGLATASRLARADPGKIVLLVAVELCTLAFRFDRASKIEVVAAALFADGAAAAVLRADEDALGIARLGAAAEHLWPDTLDTMGWTVDPVGFGIVLSQTLPRFLERHLAAPARHFLAGLDLKDPNPHMICHTGSAKVLSAIETALELPAGTLANEREVLREYGNMSSPSILFVLERTLSQNLAGPAILSALGPGFTASFVAAELGRG